MQSDGPTGDPGVSGNGTVVNTAAVAQLAGCCGTDDSEVLACLRQLPAASLLNAVLQFENITAANGVTQDIFFPTIDGSYVPDAPSTLIRTGRFHKNVSVIAGWNENDGSIFTPPTLNSTDAVLAFLQTEYPNLSASTLSTLVSLYPLSGFVAGAEALTASPYFLQASHIYRDVNFACGAINVAHHVARFNSASYLYILNTTSLASVLALFNATFEGVLHFSDVPFVFNQPNVGFGTTAEANLTAAQMSGSWARFATTGDPSGNPDVTVAGWTQAFNKSEAAIQSQNVTSETIRVIGGPSAGNLSLDPNPQAPGLIQRCEFINSPAFYQQLQT